MGGPARLAVRARELLSANEPDMALALIQFAVDAAPAKSPESAELHGLRAAILRAKEAQETSLMARNIFGSFRRTSERLQGQGDPASVGTSAGRL